MMYDELLARSFSKNEKKKLGFWGVLLGCFVIALSSCAAFNSFIGPLPILNLNFTRGMNLDDVFSSIIMKPTSRSDNFTVSDGKHSNYSSSSDQGIGSGESNNKLTRILDHHVHPRKQNTTKVHDDAINSFMGPPPLIEPVIKCNFSSPKSDFCEINTPVQVHGQSSTIFIKSSSSNTNQNWTLKPYARNKDLDALTLVTQFTILLQHFSQMLSQHCTVNHTVPAVLFSTGGYTGNHFHEFTDILVPLYLTSHHYNRQVQFLITNHKSWWIHKFQPILTSLSKYKPINIDNDKEIHCFPSMIVGLEGHKEFGIDTNTSLISNNNNNYSMRTFAQFIRTTYLLPRNIVVLTRRNPKLLIISRKKSRVLLNEKGVANLARKLGFEVDVVSVSSGLTEFARKVNTYDVYLGVHGAGLTNMVFLPENAVVVQVVPLGLDWLSKYDFELPAMEMGLRYLEYKVNVKESSVKGRKSGEGVRELGWIRFKKIYLDGQNVKIDLRRFKGTLIKAREILRSSS